MKKDDIKYIDTAEEVAAYGIRSIKEILSNGSSFVKLIVFLVVGSLCSAMIIGAVYAIKQIF